MRILRCLGAKYQLANRVLVAAALAMLTSCTHDIHIDLLNESGGGAEIVHHQRSRTKNESVANLSRIFVRGTNPLVIRAGGVERSYDLSVLPPEFVRTTSKGLVVSIALGADWKLYLLQTGKKPLADRVVSQPVPFPLSPL